MYRDEPSVWSARGGAGATPWLSAEVQGVAASRTSKGVIGMQAVADRRYVLFLMGGLIALAWLTLWLWGQSPYGRWLHHDELSRADLGNGLVVLVMVVGWTLMIVAMMLPTSLPLVALFHRLTRQRQDHALLVGLLLGGYLSMWTVFGMVVHVGDGLLHAAVAQSAWLEAHAWAMGAGILVVAGLYQFTPLKYACLDQCRSPLSFITEHWRGNRERTQAFRLGMRHGLFCIGCCWSLMLLMFAVGVGNFGWMLVLGALMAIEKNLPWGRRISAPLGVVLLCWGLALGLEAVLA
jgi:predicted metal-binding membrane protein